MKGSVAVASSSQLSADAGAETAERGGNAVDAAIAAALTSMNTEPGVCGLGGGGFATIWRAGEQPVTIDGYAAVPGRGLSVERLGKGGVEIFIKYGGGVRSIVGPGSVAVPGSVAALGEASASYGILPWDTLFQPVIKAAEHGFPLSKACYDYLLHSGDCIFGQDRVGWKCLHDNDGQLKKIGDVIHVPHLATSLQQLAEQGASEFYVGELGQRIADHVLETGGNLNREDLAQYRPITRKALVTPLGSWEIATNPAPAIGGVILTAMLALTASEHPSLPKARIPRQIAIQKLILGYRQNRLNKTTKLVRDLGALMNAVSLGDLSFLESPSTVHTSAVDTGGLACSITMSTGYGSGLMAPESGIWLNNCLGELELNPLGLKGRIPGERLPSNMAPTVARDDRGCTLAIGSPGADRITTALLQVLHRHLLEDIPLQKAIGAPRIHLEYGRNRIQLAHEPNISLPTDSLLMRPFAERSMYFGGVGAARAEGEKLEAVADPRRAGGARIVTHHN
jgi:gamma-glutamyltranspeptidase/glutathione hydrolase